MQGQKQHEQRGLEVPGFAAIVGERSAVDSNSGATVTQSVPGLKRPTPPTTAGRTPAARPPVPAISGPVKDGLFESREAGLSVQPKTGPGYGAGSPVVEIRREATDTSSASVCREADTLNESPERELTEYEIRQFIEFFTTLDRWDREAHGHENM